MKIINRKNRSLVILTASVISLLYSGISLAVDDGARAYWKAREGANIISFQKLDLSLNATRAQQFDPGPFIYQN